MIRNIVLVVVGVLIGAIGSHLMRTWQPAPEAVPVATPAIQSTYSTRVRDSSEKDIGDQAEVAPPVESGRADRKDQVVRLPTKYADMIAQSRPRSPTFAERHEKFASEDRDESWAFAMEAGIQNFLAVHAPVSGIVIESVECRSESCEVSGYLSDDTDGINSAIFGFTSEHWWDGGNAVSVKEFDLEEGTGFVFVTYEHDGFPFNR